MAEARDAAGMTQPRLTRLRFGMRSPTLRACRAILRQRHHFASNRDWLKRVFDGLLRRLPPLRRWSKHPVWTVRIKGFHDPFLIRKTSKDWVALRETLFQGEYDLLRDHVDKSPDTILDLGANIGLSVRVWLEWFPGARIVAVEPDPENCSTCRLNIDATGEADRVQLLEYGVAAERGIQYLDRSREPMEYRMSSQPVPDSIEIPARTVEETLSKSGMDFVDLLKCDIEGGERELFRNCGSWISMIGLLLVELHPPYGHQQLLEHLRANGTQPRTLERIDKPSGTELAIIALDGIDLSGGS